MQTTDQRPLTKHIFKTSKGENLYYEKTDNIPGCIIHCSIYCMHMQKQPDGRKKTETGITTTPTEIPLQIHGRNPEMTGIT